MSGFSQISPTDTQKKNIYMRLKFESGNSSCKKNFNERKRAVFMRDFYRKTV